MDTRKLMIMLTGGAIGGITGYFIAGLILYKMQEKEVENRLNEMNDSYEKELKGKEETLEKDNLSEYPTQLISESEWDEVPINVRKPIRIRSYDKLTKADINKIAEKYAISDKDEENNNGPVVITKERFDDVRENHKGFMIYWDTDDILSDKDGKVQENPEFFIGDALVNFGKDSSNPDIVYVYNPSLDIGYEIERVFKSHAEEYLGVEPIEEVVLKTPKGRARSKKSHKVDMEE